MGIEYEVLLQQKEERIAELLAEVETEREAKHVLSEEVTRLRCQFDTTRHKVLKAMCVTDMGHGWFWVTSTIGDRARENRQLRATLAMERMKHGMLRWVLMLRGGGVAKAAGVIVELVDGLRKVWVGK